MLINSTLGRIGLSLFAVILLSIIVFANGFGEFMSAPWIYEAVSIGAFFFALITLSHRAITVAHKGWKRASLVASAVGVLMVEVLFFNQTGLNASGEVIAFVILMGWGILVGLAFVEGLRWVENGFAKEQGSFSDRN